MLKGQLLIALYSIRSDRALCEQLDYNLLYRWFLDLELDAPGVDQSHFSWLRQRLIDADVANRFFNAVLAQARQAELLSTEHFTVDGTLIEALASLKSLKPRADGNGNDSDLPPPVTDGSGMRNWKGQRRSNKTHVSATDPQAKLMRKGNGQSAKLSYGAHVLMDNRHGLCAELEVTDATEAEHRVADRLLGRARRRRWRVRSVGADKGYCVREFIARCRQRRIRPHVACIDGRCTPALDARTTRHAGYAVSQRKRKRVDGVFGWLKTYGGLRKTRFVGRARGALHATLAATAYNLLRMAKLVPMTARPTVAAHNLGKADETRHGKHHRSKAWEFCVRLLATAR